MTIGDTSATALSVGALLAAIVALSANVIKYDRDKSFYAVVLTVVGAFYPLFAIMAGGDALIPEIAFFALFAAIAAAGFIRSPWIVAFGLLFHGVFDFVRQSYLNAPGAPEWWPAFCGAYDVVAALGLAVLLFCDQGRTAPFGRPE